MIGALPAIGFLSTGMGMSGLTMGLGALATFAGGLTGPDYTDAGRLPAYEDLASPTGNFSAYVNQMAAANPAVASYYAQYNQAIAAISSSNYAQASYGSYPSYGTPQSYPVSYGTGMASYDARSAFSHPYVYGSQAGYQGQFGGYSPYSGYGYGYGYGGNNGYGTGSYQAPAYGYGQPSYGYGYGQQFGAYYSGSTPSPQYSSAYSYGSTSSQRIPLGDSAKIENGVVRYPYLPSFSNTESYHVAAEQVRQRLVGGSAADQAAIHNSGIPPFDNSDGRAAERTTVWWALQANDQLRYNVETKSFFITNPDGTTRNIDTLSNLMNVRRAGGWSDFTPFQRHIDYTRSLLNQRYPPWAPGYG